MNLWRNLQIPLLSLLLAIICCLGAPPVFAQALPSDDSAVAALSLALPHASELISSQFRIGYIRSSSETTRDDDWFQNMRQFLLDDQTVSSTLHSAGFSGISLSSCDSADDMLQRMDQMEFEMVFCPGIVYVRNRLNHPGLYRVILQSRAHDDLYDSRGGGPVRQRGVFFVRKGSDLDPGKEGLASSKFRELLPGKIIAVPRSNNASGFLYIQKMLWNKYDKYRHEKFLYCTSSAEVVKAVASGLVDIGACEESVLPSVFNSLPNDLLGQARIVDGGNSFIRILDYTQWVPTDPVVIQERQDPTFARSQLGAAILDSVKKFYARSKDGSVQMERATDSAYDEMAEDLRLLQGVLW